MACTSPDGRRWTKAEGGTAFAPVVDPAIGAASSTSRTWWPATACPEARPSSRWVRPGPLPARRRRLQLAGWPDLVARPGRSRSGRRGARQHRRVGRWPGSGGQRVLARWLPPDDLDSSDGAAWAPLSAADLDQSRSGDRGDAFMTDLVADGSGLVAVGGASPLSEPLGAIVWAGAGPGEIVADHACPAVIDSPARLGSMTPADRAACIGAVPVTVQRARPVGEQRLLEPEQPPALSGCGALLYVAPLEGGPDVAQIGIDPSLVERFGPTDSTGSTARRPGS